MNEILHDISWVVPLRNDFLTGLFEFFTWLGYPTFIMLALAVGYWLLGKDRFTRVAVIVIISTVLNAFLKDLWQNPRPDIAFRLDAEVGTSFGMPSGHAQISAVLWFWMAYEFRRAWFWGLAVIMVAGICVSRIYLGIHDLEDILAGLILAALSLSLYRVGLGQKLEVLRQGRLCLTLFAIMSLGLLVKLAWPDQENSIGALVVFGLLLAWLLGASIETRLVRFKPRQEIWSRVVVVVLGLACLMALLALSKLALSGLEPLLAGTISSALLGLTMTLFAPLLFKLCRLSESS